MVDATESWNESQDMASGRALQEAGIVWLEDPVNHQNIAGLAHLSQALDVPIAAGERLFGVEPFVRTLEARAVNIAIIDLARVGAITPWMKVAALAEAKGVPSSGQLSAFSYQLPWLGMSLMAQIETGAPLKRSAGLVFWIIDPESLTAGQPTG